MSPARTACDTSREYSVSQTADALIVGGGLAGSTLAITLKRSGRSVVLLEKSAGPHAKVCGEFLSHEAIHYLAVLGVDPIALGAVPIEAVRLARHDVIASHRLPFTALSLSRKRLDEALLACAAGTGVRVVRGYRVQSLTQRQACWVSADERGDSIAARAAFLATGKHDLRGWVRGPGKQNDLIAFKMYFQLASHQQQELERNVEVVLFPGGYAGLQLVEDGIANCCLLVRRSIYRKAGGSWPALLAYIERHAKHLATRLEGATALWARPLSLSSIPYGLLRADARDELWRVGDQSAVIPSFAGDGMSIALHSAMLAARTYLEGGSAHTYQQQLAKTMRRQLSLATLVSRSLVGVPDLSLALAQLWTGSLSAVAKCTRISSKDLIV